MNDRTVTELVIDANTSGAADYERAMASASQAAQRGTDAANNFNINLVALGTGAIAAGFAIKKVLDEIVGANKELADMGALAVRVGLSLKDLQGVEFGGKIAGLTDQQINQGLEKSAQLLNDAQRNANSLSKEFEANGRSIRNSNGQLISQNQLMQIAADLVSRARSPQDAIAIAQMLGFTKEWVPLLQQGSGAMKALGDEAAKAGAVIDDETIKKATQFDAEWRKSSVIFNSSMKAALVDLLPLVNQLITGAEDFVKGMAAANGAVGSGQQKFNDWANAASFSLKFDDGTASITDYERAIEMIQRKGKIVPQEMLDNLNQLKSEAAAAAKELDGLNRATQAINFPNGVPMPGSRPKAANDIGDPSIVANRGTDANDAVDRAINTLRKHTEVQLADAAAMGQGVAVQAEYRAQAAQTAAVQANQGRITAAQAAEFAKLTKQAGEAALVMEKARVNEQIRFGRDTATLTPQDVQIAQQLRGIYPDVTDALNSTEAAQLRFNASIRDMSSSFQTSAGSALLDFQMGLTTGGDALRRFEQQFVRSLLNMANQMLIITPLMQAFKSLVNSLGIGPLSESILPGLPGSAFFGPAKPSANGNAFDGGNIIPFARGGVIDRPTMAPMALMGEAGPEAVMPLKRGADGRLGVSAAGGAGPQTIHVSMSIDLTGANGEETIARISSVAAKAAFNQAVKTANETAPANQRRYAMLGS